MSLTARPWFDEPMAIAANTDDSTTWAYATMAATQNRVSERDRRPAGGAVAAIEIWGRYAYERVVTLSERATIVGSDPDRADVVVDDATVSGVHIVIEQIAGTFIVHDLGSRNGTLVNDERLLGDRRLRHKDEIQIGQSRVLFLDAAAERRPKTAPLEQPPPNITRTEKRVLIGGPHFGSNQDRNTSMSVLLFVPHRTLLIPRERSTIG